MDQVQRMQIRVPRILRDWLKSRAKDNNRSMNGEIIHLMKKAQEEENQIIA